MTVTHSKSAVPAAVLDDRVALRRLMQRIVFSELDEHRANGRLPSADDTRPLPSSGVAGVYDDPSQSYAWLGASSGPEAELADDVLDTMRALRAADVLRQRGTVLRTSGGFELCMDAETARAVCTMRSAAGDAAFVIAYDDERGAGEANIRVAFVTPRGDLRIAFHRGAFGSDGGRSSRGRECRGCRRGHRGGRHPDLRRSGRRAVAWCHRAAAIDDVQIQLERPDDRPGIRRRGRRPGGRSGPVARFVGWSRSPTSREQHRTSAGGSTRPSRWTRSAPRRTR